MDSTLQRLNQRGLDGNLLNLLDFGDELRVQSSKDNL